MIGLISKTVDSQKGYPIDMIMVSLVHKQIVLIDTNWLKDSARGPLKYF